MKKADEIEIPDGFTKWGGGSACPVVAHIVTRGGFHRITRVDNLDWGHFDDDEDIIAYRIVP